MKKRLLVFFIFVLLFFMYSLGYLYFKYRHAVIQQPKSFRSSIFIKEERVNYVLFHCYDKSEIAVFYFFWPLSKIEKIFNKDLDYFIVIE